MTPEALASYAKRLQSDQFDSVYQMLAIVTDSYAEYVDASNRLGNSPMLGWEPKYPGKALAETQSPLNLRHLSLNFPVSQIDETFNGATNDGQLISLFVNDVHELCPTPIAFDEAWVSNLKMVHLAGTHLDPGFARTLENTDLLNLQGTVLDPAYVPPNIEYLSAEDCDVLDAHLLRELPKLRALRISHCRKVPDLARLELPGLHQLESLVLERFSRVEDLEILASLPNLRFLGIGGMNKVRDFSPLLALEKLELLHITTAGLKNADFTTLAPLLQQSSFRHIVGVWPEQLPAPPDDKGPKLSSGENWSGLLPFPLRHHYHR